MNLHLLQRGMKKTTIPDRFDDLPDHIIQNILSFLETKDAIRTSVLSTRWKHMWNSVPCLYFNSLSFKQLSKFKKFVLRVLRRRGNSPVTFLFYLRFGGHGVTDQYLLNKVIEYAALHGVEEIIINLGPKKDFYSPPVEIPLALFTCESLKRLELIDCLPTNLSSPVGRKSLDVLHLEHIMFPTAVDISNPFKSLVNLFGFTTLTTLHLNNFVLSDTRIERMDLFASCVNMEILQLSEMSFSSDSSPEDFVISPPKLVNLCLMCNYIRSKIVIDSPQLLSFTYLYSAPAFLEFCFPSLDGLIIDIREPLAISHRNKREDTLHGLIRMLREHHEAEVVKLSFCTIAVTCGAEAFEKPECFSSTIWKSLNIKVGSTYKIYIDKLDRIIPYFRNCSQNGDYEIMPI